MRYHTQKKRASARSTAGLTLVELLIVVVVISVVAALAIPALNAFRGGDRDLSVATATARLVNKTRDQARRRNRAYFISFNEFGQDEPTGTMEIREGKTNRCSMMVADAIGNSHFVEKVPFGITEVPGYNGKVERSVGLVAYRLTPDVEEVQTGPLEFCVGADGAIFQRTASAGAFNPIEDRLRIAVQRYEGGPGNWRREAPRRALEVTFAGGAQLVVQ